MTGIDDAQARWQEVRAKGRTRLIIILVVAVVVLGLIAVLSKGSAGIVVGIVVGVIVVIGAVYLVVSKRKTGLSLTPEWAPKDTRRDDFDDDDDDDGTPSRPAPAAAPAEPVEPLRKVDAQILGADLLTLGQRVGPKLEKSYALGNLLIEDGQLAWEPTQISAGQGAKALSASPSEVAVVERTALWGSWALFRVEGTDGSEWCLRIPSSVDLAPALSELGLTLR